MEELKIVVELLKSLGVGAMFGPALSLIILMYVLRKYVFAGWGTALSSTAKSYFSNELEHLKAQTEIAQSLQEIVRQLESLTQKVSDELRANAERVRTLELAMSDYLSSFHELNDLVQEVRQHVVAQGENGHEVKA